VIPQDKTIGGDLVVEVRAGGLVLRNMGYFSLGEFSSIESRGAWWLTRLPITTRVTLDNGTSLEKRLREGPEQGRHRVPKVFCAVPGIPC
jgi:hypothetical protein